MRYIINYGIKKVQPIPTAFGFCNSKKIARENFAAVKTSDRREFQGSCSKSN